MSHSSGVVKFEDDEVWYYEYNGTVDAVISCLYDDYNDMIDNWRNHEFKSCECDNEERVVIYSDYGGGFYFNGYACRKCRSVRAIKDRNLGNKNRPYWVRKEKRGKPEWYDKIKWKEKNK